MRTVSLRFTDKFAPDGGTILAHESIIKTNGWCWYGKLGLPLSDKVIAQVLDNKSPQILLIHSGQADRYWMHITDIKKEMPDKEMIPAYYRDMSGFNTFFKATSFEPAEKNVISKCTVASSGVRLGEASIHSMSPYFIIDYNESM